MPRIIVQAQPNDENEPVIVLAERISVSDMESNHFNAQLIERLGWAVSDARAVELPAER